MCSDGSGSRRVNTLTEPPWAAAGLMRARTRGAQAEPFMYFGREVAASSRRVVVDYALPQVGGSRLGLAA